MISPFLSIGQLWLQFYSHCSQPVDTFIKALVPCQAATAGLAVPMLLLLLLLQYTYHLKGVVVVVPYTKQVNYPVCAIRYSYRAIARAAAFLHELLFFPNLAR